VQASIDKSLIKVENLEKSFGNLKVLRGINIDIPTGQNIVVIGASGSGKSTFLRCLNLLEKPTAGKIYFEGIDITDKKANINIIRQKIGMVFQHFNLFPNMSVLKNLMIAPMRLQNASYEKAKERALSYLERVGLLDKAEVYPSQLSGGQKQRVAIVRSLCMQPTVMLFDEPTSALDPEMVSEVLEVMKTILKDITMLVVTHEMSFAREAAHKIVFMDEGLIIEQGSPSQIFDKPHSPRLKTFLSKIREGKCHKGIKWK
jgi:polar amino acid transport system ATP-binding protein